MSKKKNTITKEHVDKLLHASRFTYSTEFGKTTVVTCQLPNGFVISESSSCVDPNNYDEKLGYEICIKKITEKIWELEGYRLQCEIARKNTKSLILEEATIGDPLDRGFVIELDNITSNSPKLEIKLGGGQ